MRDGSLWYVTPLLFFSQKVLLSLRGTAISYFRHGLIQYFPNKCTMEIVGVGKQSIPGLIKLSVLKIKCRKIPFYYLLGNSPASEFSGELPRRKHTTFRTRRKFEIKNNFIQLSIIENIPWNTFSFYVFEQDL